MIAPVMLRKPIPEEVDPVKLAQKAVSLTGSLTASDFPALQGEPYSVLEGQVSFEMHFGRDSQNQCLIEGKVCGELTLECALCLKPVGHTVNCQFALRPVTSTDEAKALEEAYEPVLMDQGRVFPLFIVQEEILLSLPQVAKHSEGICTIALSVTKFADNLSSNGQGPKNPFSVLEFLKRKPE